ncbi:MAG: hypothetical protein AB8B77_06085 [Alphaproteobacteria bacterium]
MNNPSNNTPQNQSLADLPSPVKFKDQAAGKDALTLKIAQAINKADTNFFNENYTKQAQAVLKVLEKEGLVIMPAAADDAMIEAGIKALKDGRFRPADVVRDFYKSMIKAGSLY